MGVAGWISDECGVASWLVNGLSISCLVNFGIVRYLYIAEFVLFRLTKLVPDKAILSRKDNMAYKSVRSHNDNLPTRTFCICYNRKENTPSRGKLKLRDKDLN